MVPEEYNFVNGFNNGGPESAAPVLNDESRADAEAQSDFDDIFDSFSSQISS